MIVANHYEFQQLITVELSLAITDTKISLFRSNLNMRDIVQYSRFISRAVYLVGSLL